MGQSTRQRRIGPAYGPERNRSPNPEALTAFPEFPGKGSFIEDFSSAPENVRNP